MQTVKSLLYANETVINRNPRAGADEKYYIAYIEEFGELKPLLLTDYDVMKAKKRALSNTEDLLPPASRFQHLVGTIGKLFDFLR
jgi:hypothetical protein